MKKRYFKNGKITPNMQVSDVEVNTIDENGTGWLTCDICNMIKPRLQFVINDWLVTETATPEEIAKHKQQLQQQADAEFQARKKADGIRYADEINTKLIGIMRGKSQSEMDTLDIEFRVRILKYLDLIEGGDWWTARRMIDNISLPKLQEIKTLFLKVRSDIRKYVTENYK